MVEHAKLQSLIKPLMHRVFLKVHPDFFAHDPVAKNTNQASMQRLQDILAPVLKAPEDSSTKERHSKSKELTSTPLEFISRAKDGTREPVSFTFTAREARHGMRQLRAQRTQDLLRLCQALKVQLAPEAIRDVEIAIDCMKNASDITAALDSSQGVGRHAALSQAVAELRAARAREAHMSYKRANKCSHDPIHAAMMAQLRSSGAQATGSLDAKHAAQKLNRSMVFFADSVNPRHYHAAIERIESELHELDYGLWCALPLMVVDSWKSAFRGSAARYPGFVVIPRQFSKQAFLRYLHTNLADIRQARESRTTEWLSRS
ncbi:hypothetical protein GGI25_004868 [Coemansia spiralis]|uniref:DUF4460 domain-containing protein n=1 Tax=Coemansia spiralis TaxID=417178 RepID=A0A9W8KWS0_9FUNG|nr:hypothetical protein GGI25_004868 [Coemansia spiralis]